MCREVLLIELECKRCQLRFNICRKCYRGHLYCSSSCRRVAQLKAHSRNEKKRRMGRIKKTMADESTNHPPLRVILYPIVQNTKARCRFCGVYGKIVAAFPRR